MELAGCVLRNEQGEILLLHRNKKDRVQWELPGGKREEGETTEAAAIREIKEELGVDVRLTAALGGAIFVENQARHSYTWYDAALVQQSDVPRICEPQTFDDLRYWNVTELTNRDDLSANLQNLLASGKLKESRDQSVVICSHGFGVTADSRGMFPEIARNIPDAEFVMFDYNDVRPNGNTVMASLDAQAKILQRHIDEAREDVVLLCHSQGSMIAGLVDLTKVQKAILLAPPVNMSMQRVIGKMLDRPGSTINPDGLSELPRTDGTTTYLPKEYLQSLDAYTPMELYQTIVNTVPTVIVRATADEVIGLTNVNEITGATHYDITADHNFSGESRRELIEILAKELFAKQ